ncbi:SGNH/GDSL hydrolase family protein [Desulfosporosinus youngiae]|uniref:Lysophospholipase L1-like esterase n=1 Tax=Desulfosporosinus youngiae DSM 17734 TaxID=768710 RepID=H5XZG9_9FIRM|nr:GDSL-type esterase/lipase family protein [Desulfosporosinus youngiae]EHQ91875.1 lysophospholipase L1-like esterase [Desulfosporosinus youngiae DSM 17734]
MMKITKLELYIILAAFSLALLVIGIFWVFNRGETPSYSLKQPSPPNTVSMDSTTDSIVSDAEAAAPDPLIVAQNTITQQGLAKLIEPTTVKALVFGDAVAGGQVASNANELSWHALISKKLEDKYPGNLQWQFKTTPEATIQDVLTYVPEVAPNTDLIILCLGRNDWTIHTTHDFQEKYEQLIIDLKAQSPQGDLFLIAEPPVKSIDRNNKSFPYRQIILGLGQKHQLPVIDEWSAFISDPTPLNGLLADGVNPSDKGYEVFAEAVLKEFEEKLVKAPR